MSNIDNANRLYNHIKQHRKIWKYIQDDTTDESSEYDPGESSESSESSEIDDRTYSITFGMPQIPYTNLIEHSPAPITGLHSGDTYSGPLVYYSPMSIIVDGDYWHPQVIGTTHYIDGVAGRGFTLDIPITDHDVLITYNYRHETNSDWGPSLSLSQDNTGSVLVSVTCNAAWIEGGLDLTRYATVELSVNGGDFVNYGNLVKSADPSNPDEPESDWLYRKDLTLSGEDGETLEITAKVKQYQEPSNYPMYVSVNTDSITVDIQ